MSARNEDFLFAQEAQAKGYVTESQIEEAFELQRRMAEELKIEERIAVILVKRGWMAEEQARRIYGLLDPGGGGEARIEGYRLMEKIGRGAMGTVYKAIHLGLHRVVAIKVLRRELVGEKVHSERLKREAQMLAELDHPNIVRAMDAGESNGFPYVVMEYVEGETLKERINREGPLDEDDALDITRALADALERARRMGVVHRDVKPGNILISKRGTPKLMDLGLAKGPVDLELTQHGATVGTPQFMSPEQAQEAGRADTRSDIYSLGATLYAMLTGRPPHSGTTMAEIITKVLYRQPAPIRMLRPEAISPEVSYLVERMMLKDPALRYQTPSAICEDIDRITGGRSIVPQGFTGNWEAWLLRQKHRKRQRLLTTATVVLLVLGLGTWAFVRHRARTEARQQIAVLAQQLTELRPEGEFAEGQAWRDRLAEARRIDKEIGRIAAAHDVSPPYDASIHLEGLETYDNDLVAWGDIDKRVYESLSREEFRQAVERLGTFQSRTRFQAMADRVNGLRETISETSRTTWQREVSRVQARRPESVQGLVRALDGLQVELASKKYLGTEAILKARTTVQGHFESSRSALRRLRSYEDEFSPGAIRARVATNDLFQLASRMAKRRGEVERVAASFTGRSWFDASARFSLLEFLVRPRLRDVQTRLTNAIEERTEELLDEGTRAEGIPALERAYQSIADFVRALRRISVPSDERLGAMEIKLGNDLEALKGERGRLLESTLGEVLAAFQRGDAEEIEKQIATARAEAGEGTALAREVAELAEAATASRRLRQAALKHLATRTGKKLEGLELAKLDEATGGPLPLTADLVAVEETGTLRMRPEGASSRTIVSYALEDFALAQRVAWASVAGLERDIQLWALLARLPTASIEAVHDLLRVEETFASLETLLAAVTPTPAWLSIVEIWEDRVRREQERRDFDVAAAFTLIENHWNHGDLQTVIERAEQFLDPQARTWHTRKRDQHQERVETLLDLAVKQIERNKLQRWLRGARAREDESGVARIEIDFTIPRALDLFRHGLARLVDDPGRAVTVPGESLRERRLRLLPGIDGVRRGRPLSLDNLFEPTERMVVEFDLYTLEGAFLLAIDMDGIQVAIHSGDPNWYPDWKLPESFRMEPTDDLMAWYGRGRGVALHYGRGFGDLDRGRWSWLERQRGRHHETWRREPPEDGALFAFAPQMAYRVRVVRDGGSIELHVADLNALRAAGGADGAYRLMIRKRDRKWDHLGVRSDASDRVRGGTGMLQILSWTEVEIDNLHLEGRLRPSWRKAREADDRRAKENR